MSIYSGVVDCHCGRQHKLEGVSNFFTKYNAFGFHSFLARHVSCARCLKVEFQTTENYELTGEKHSDDYICNECKPIAIKRHIEKFDGLTPGTTQMLEKLDECLARIAKIEERLTDLEQYEN